MPEEVVKGEVVVDVECARKEVVPRPPPAKEVVDVDAQQAF
jgi:hypothetical protein